MDRLSYCYHFAQLLDNPDLGIIITDSYSNPGPNILYINQALLNFTGYTLGEVVGKSIRILQSPNNDETLLEKVYEKIMIGDSFVVELENKKKNGELFNVRLTIGPYGSNNEYRICTSPFFNPRANNVIESVQSTLERVLGIEEGVYIKTESFYPYRIILAERNQTKKKLGWNVNTLESKSLIKLIHPNIVESFCVKIQKALDDQCNIFKINFALLTSQRVYKQAIGMVEYDIQNKTFAWMISVSNTMDEQDFLSGFSRTKAKVLKSERDEIQDSIFEIHSQRLQAIDNKIDDLKEKNQDLKEKYHQLKNNIDDIFQKLVEIYPPLTEKGGIIWRYRKSLKKREDKIKKIKFALWHFLTDVRVWASVGSALVFLLINYFSFLSPDHQKFIEAIKDFFDMLKK